ncbi:MAG: hypothetical protein DDT22_01057 [candidate division WS2 bacterium]|nr:hypothetical protein [Candidatus Lithacetigena glycinireducens]MBT9175382.1 hypothetical protein [Candidatus Lithacetigena glycinireducens]
MEKRPKIGLGGKINILSDEEWLRGESSIRRGVCPRCDRNHSGPCGIPGTVTGHIPSARPRVAPRPKRWPSTPIYPIRIEPLPDVFEEDSQIKVIVEMPGVEKEIKVLLEDRTLKVSAEGIKKFYEAEIELPKKVKPEFSKEYHNGILTITLEGLEEEE